MHVYVSGQVPGCMLARKMVYTQHTTHPQSTPSLLYRHVRLVSTTSEISALSVGPKVVLASLPSLSAGPARQLFVEWAGDPRNAIILPGAPQAGTLAEALALVGQGGDPVERGHAGWRRQAGGRWEVDVELRRRVVLTGVCGVWGDGCRYGGSEHGHVYTHMHTCIHKPTHPPTQKHT